MARCGHGFERSVLPCKACGDKLPVPVKRERRGAEHPGFVNLTGFERLGARVLHRVKNHAGGTARWLIRLPCGHEIEMLSTAIVFPRKKYWRCSVCKTLVCEPATTAAE